MFCCWAVQGDIMHFPKNNRKNCYNHNEYQQNILQQMLENRDPQTGLPIGTYWCKDAKWQEEQARLRIWKMLRELDTMPVFIPHLEEELLCLLRLMSRKEHLIAEIKSLVTQLDHKQLRVERLERETEL
jgi:hypothetical protein